MTKAPKGDSAGTPDNTEEMQAHRWLDETPAREPTSAEKRAIEAAQYNSDRRPARAAVAIAAIPSGIAVRSVHNDAAGQCEHLRDTFGSSSDDFVDTAMLRLQGVIRPKSHQALAKETNGILAAMGAIAPANELEAIIGEQIVAAHSMSLDLLGKAQQSGSVEKSEAYVNMATKLSRTMATHVETLTRLRSGGKQQVIVKHVYVNGNAVVVDHAQTVIGTDQPGGSIRKFDQSHAAGFLDAPGVQMRCEDQGRDAMPIAGGPRPEALPNARGHKSRRAARRGQRPVPDGKAHTGVDAGEIDGPRIRPVGEGNGR